MDNPKTIVTMRMHSCGVGFGRLTLVTQSCMLFFCKVLLAIENMCNQNIYKPTTMLKCAHRKIVDYLETCGYMLWDLYASNDCHRLCAIITIGMVTQLNLIITLELIVKPSKVGSNSQIRRISHIRYFQHLF